MGMVGQVSSDLLDERRAARRWQTNADEIAAFLNKPDPKYWQLADAKGMLRSHLELTTAEVVAHLQKNWPADVAAYDKVHEQMLAMADMLSSGIKNQFPDKVAAR